MGDVSRFIDWVQGATPRAVSSSQVSLQPPSFGLARLFVPFVCGWVSDVCRGWLCVCVVQQQGARFAPHLQQQQRH